jgi:hypothetical protein
MATSVTFKCTCPQSVVAITVQASEDPTDTEVMTFKTSGSKTVDLSTGSHDVSYRAVGTPGSDLKLEVTKGGKMRTVDRVLGGDGRAAGLRTLVVE